MGNSTLDCLVFGRRSGVSTAEYVGTGKEPGTLALDHIQRYADALKKAGIETGRRAPILLPEYRGKEVLARMIDIM